MHAIISMCIDGTTFTCWPMRVVSCLTGEGVDSKVPSKGSLYYIRHRQPQKLHTQWCRPAQAQAHSHICIYYIYTHT